MAANNQAGLMNKMVLCGKRRDLKIHLDEQMDMVGSHDGKMGCHHVGIHTVAPCDGGMDNVGHHGKLEAQSMQAVHVGRCLNGCRGQGRQVEGTGQVGAPGLSH